MLSIPKKFAVAASVLAVTAGIAATAQISSPASSAAARKATVSISIVPGIIGPGKGLQSSASAQWAVIGKYSPTKEGKKVVLQRQSGTTWVVAGKSVIDKKGNVIFGVPGAVTGALPVVYRVDGPGPASTPVSTDRWGSALDFVDDFSGTALSDQWQYRQSFYEVSSLRACSKGDPRAVKVANGTAQLSVLIDKARSALCKPKKPGKTKIFGKYRYRLNANIGTQDTHVMKFGVLAARIKFQPLQGQHASLWMQPQINSPSKDPKVAGDEVDVIEWFGKDVPNGGLTSFIYAPSAGGKKIGGWISKPEQYLSNPKDDWYKRYHVFSVEWTPSSFIFRIDGQETRRITTTGKISQVAEYPIISLLSSDYELGNLPDEKKDLPQTMNVDWIHMWQDPTALPPTPTPTPTP
jgi:hypothetical protein